MTTLTHWDKDPVSCFNDFVLTQDFVATGRRVAADVVRRPISAESAVVYRAMFGNFATWLQGERKTMSTVDQADLLRFIGREEDDKPVLNSKIAYRYLRLLERCFDYLARAPNPAQLAIRGIDRAHMAHDAGMTALSHDELQRFLAALPSSDGTSPGAWKRHRDRAMQIVMALGGLRVAETVGLLLEEVGRQRNVDGTIDLDITPARKHQTSYQHKTVLMAPGAAALTAWLEHRATLGIPGNLVFPANLLGAQLDKATVYRQTRATFERAGLAARRAGGRTLRNTFAVEQLREGTSSSELTGYLGLALERSTEVYQQVKPGVSDDQTPE